MAEKVDLVPKLRELHEQTYGEKMAEMFFSDLSLVIIIIMSSYQFDGDFDFEGKNPAKIQKSLRENGLHIDPENILLYRTLQTELMDLDKEPELT